MRKLILAAAALLVSAVAANATPIAGSFTVTDTSTGATIVLQNDPFSYDLALNGSVTFNIFTLVDPIPPARSGQTTSTVTTNFNFNAPVAGMGVVIGGETANRNGNSQNYNDTINWNQVMNPNGVTTVDFSDGAILQITLADTSSGNGPVTIQNTATFKLTAAPAATAVPEPVTLSVFGAGLVGAAAMRRRRQKKA